MRSAQCGGCGAAVRVRGQSYRRCRCGFAGEPVIHRGRFRPEVVRYVDAPERRSMTWEVRAHADVAELRVLGDTVTGYAAVYGQASANFDGFTEVLEPGCFDGAICEGANILCRVDHKIVIGDTNTAGSLDVWTDDVGLGYACRVAEWDEPVLRMVQSGFLDGSSFAFMLAPRGRDRWGLTASGHRVREILDVGDLVDVAPVRSGAYPDSPVAVRGLDPVAARRVIERKLVAA